jgi:transcriptional regulator with XRE-family HTH domain
MLLARRIRDLRQERNWSQEDLANVSGLHRTYIGSIERAERSCTVDTLDKLALAFGISVHQLVKFPSLTAIDLSCLPAISNKKKTEVS